MKERERQNTKLLQNLFLVSTADDEKQTGNDVIIFFLFGTNVCFEAINNLPFPIFFKREMTTEKLV